MGPYLAKRLGISRARVYRLMETLGIDGKSLREGPGPAESAGVSARDEVAPEQERRDDEPEQSEGAGRVVLHRDPDTDESGRPQDQGHHEDDGNAPHPSVLAKAARARN